MCDHDHTYAVTIPVWIGMDIAGRPITKMETVVFCRTCGKRLAGAEAAILTRRFAEMAEQRR